NMKASFFTLFFLVFLSVMISALPPVNDLMYSIGKPVPQGTERVSMNQYARIVSRTNTLTIQQNFIVYNGVVTESSYLWIGDVEKIEWEIWDYLESLGRIDQSENVFTVINNGFKYALLPMKKNDHGRNNVQLTVLLEE
ncbi:MAG: hypothetical protein FWG36_10530, partial [Oscillospiraceae bacterium]|nr:hypothetical protein [Oscillospiraceae bacterium]